MNADTPGIMLFMGRRTLYQESRMSTTIMDFRVREEMAGAVLKEVAALEPDERVREAQSLTQIMGEAVRGLEELWDNFREPLQSGVSPSHAAALARILTRSANLIANSVELLAGEGLAIDEFRKTTLARLRRIKAHAASLRDLAEMPAPAPDPERLRKSLEHVERDEGVDAEQLLAEIKG
jgi:hypothetical protein